MIALRGKIHKREKELPSLASTASFSAQAPAAPGASLDAPVPAATEAPAPTSATEEWIWTGEWCFGAIVDENNVNIPKLPFTYTWIQPSAPEPTEIVDAVQEAETNDTESAGASTLPIATEPSTASTDSDSIKEATALSAEPNKSGENASDPTTVPVPTDTSGETAATVTEVPQPDATPADSIVETTDMKEPSAPLPTTVEFHDTTWPANGLWKGTFNTLVGRKGQQKHKPIPEHFELQWNIAPDEAARSALAEVAPPGAAPATPTNDDPTAKETKPLPPHHVYVTGRGENQYGHFVFVGTMDTTTGMVQCQKCYVAATAPDKKPSAPRPYQTRKRQMSWKRRAAYDSGDDAGGTSTGSNNQSNSTEKQPPLKKQRLMSDASLEPESSGLPGSSGPVDANAPAATGGTVHTVAAVVAPSTTAVTATMSHKRLPMSTGPTSRPPAEGGPKKRAATKAMTGSMASVQQHAGQMKLPAAGDPHKARWRAAHFLYYHRDDPAAASAHDGTNGSNANTGTSSPMYLVYEGEMLNSHRHGRGVCLYNNGMLYEGEWRRDKEQGHGTLMSADRKIMFYQGEWERGKMHGAGVYYYMDKSINRTTPTNGKSNSRYEGEFKENLRHGTGTYVLPDKSTYVGQWREGFMCGRGVFTWPDGSVYDGEWKDGKRHGLGLLRTSDGFVYDGGWIHNAMEGRGAATYPNGQQYNGLFSRGRREGRGTILFTNGAVYEGRFRDDAIDGQGTMKMSSTMVVPRNDADGTMKKPDFMIPVSFQSDMGHIHRKAGFTNFGT